MMAAASDGEGGDGRLKLNRLARKLSNSEKLLAAASSWVVDGDLWEVTTALLLAAERGEMAE